MRIGRSQHRRFFTAGMTAAVTAGLMALASEGAAQSPRRLAVLPLEIKGRVTDVAEDNLSSKLIQSLASANFQVLAGEVVGRVVKAGGCKTQQCNRELAERLDVQFLVSGAVEIKRKDYKIGLELYDGPSGRTLGRVEESCELCGIREVSDKMDRLVRSLEGHSLQGSPVPAKLAVESEPAGVAVAVNGEARGATPLSLNLQAGEHKLTFSHDGYRGAERVVHLNEGARERFIVALAPSGSGAHDSTFGATDRPAAGGRPWRAVGWSALVTGLAATAAGAAILVLIDGEALPLAECPMDYVVDNTCTRVRDARLPGGLLVGGGAAAAILGGLTLYLSRAPESPGGSARAQGLLVNAGASF